MIRAICFHVMIASVVAAGLGASARAQDAAPEHGSTPAAAQGAPMDRKARTAAKDAAAESHTPAATQDAAEPEHFRGQITKVEGSSIIVKTRDGKTVRLGLSDGMTVISLTKASFTEVDFGTYVGAVAVRLDEYSPIVRDSAVWLHRGFELRIIDEKLRGIALGHRKWDLTPDSIISHGWVDDIEIRVLSIKWGPTDYDETDVEVPRDAPVHRMSLGDRSLIRPGAHVFAGAQNSVDGKYLALFVLVGKDGIVPSL